jgi:predicted DNA-binding transcriptional regulator YafY
MSRRADRLFRLVQLLRVRRFATAAQLAEALEVSKRTVYRDVQDLCASGVAILGEAGVGYRMERGFELPPLTFNAEEVEALVIAARMLKSVAGGELAQAADSALTKIEAVLPKALAATMQQVSTFAPQSPWAEDMTGGYLNDARTALKQKLKLELGYTRADGFATTRIIWPLGMYWWGYSWSLLGWCELRNDYRNFRLDRIQALRITSDPIPENAEISHEHFLALMHADGGKRRGRKSGTPKRGRS